MKWILLSLAVLAIAAVLRYLPLGRFLLDFRSGGVIRGIPINLAAFWLVLVVGFIVIVIKLVATQTNK